MPPIFHIVINFLHLSGLLELGGEGRQMVIVLVNITSIFTKQEQAKYPAFPQGTRRYTKFRISIFRNENHARFRTKSNSVFSKGVQNGRKANQNVPRTSNRSSVLFWLRFWSYVESQGVNHGTI